MAKQKIALTNLKLTKKERKRELEEVPTTAEGELYPWGLDLRLETESINKLGLDIKSFKIGDKVKIEANTEVVEISSSRDGIRHQKTIRLQVQDLGIKKKFAWED